MRIIRAYLNFLAVSSFLFSVAGLSIPRPSCRRRAQVLAANKIRRTSFALAAYGDYEDEGRGLSLKVLGILAVGIVGVFGTGLFSDVGSAIRSAGLESQKGSPSTLKNSGEARGSMTRLTRREINDKLRQVPFFFVQDQGTGGIYVVDGIGKLFSEKSDADELARGKSGVQVGATTADDVFYTLIERKTKLGSFVEGVAGKCDPSAKYVLVPSAKELSQTSSEWKSSHENDIPLFRIANLAFEKEGGLEIPLFLNREDALSSYGRLQDSKKTQTSSASSSASSSSSSSLAPPTVQETSLRDLVGLFSSGGFEGRALEVYPSMESIENARSLILGEKKQEQ